LTPKRIVAMALLVGGLAGCGGSGSLPRSAATLLQPRVAAIRVAASAGDPAGARAAAAEVRRMVAALQAAGDLSAKQATAILAAAAQVETQLALLAPPPETATSTITATTTTTSDAHAGKGRGKDKGGGGRE
jgi:hypothetical protein